MTRSRGSWEGEGSWRRREEEKEEIPETEYYPKMSSQAQIKPQGAEIESIV